MGAISLGPTELRYGAEERKASLDYEAAIGKAFKETRGEALLLGSIWTSAGIFLTLFIVGLFLLRAALV